jgi:aldehyde dehydrogenase (NAD+)
MAKTTAPLTRNPSGKAAALLQSLGIPAVGPGVFDGEWGGSGPLLPSFSPNDGGLLAEVRTANPAEYERTVARAHAAFQTWRTVPAPQRGDLIRQLGNALRAVKTELSLLVTLEAGKIIAEGQGEVQEMIDICDFAVGLSRQLYGLTIASERPEHRMMEQWHPLGVVGVISAFNFPVAVWAWNAVLAAVCGDPTVWKPSSHTPLTAIATTRIAERVCRANGADPALFSLVTGSGATVGDRLLQDRRVALLSATGSSKMGVRVAEAVGRRFGRTILELGGNNAVIVTPSACLDLAERAILFGAVGTAGQRCTSTRRLIVHESHRDELVKRLKTAYARVVIGDPTRPRTLMGPLINAAAVADMQAALAAARAQGAEILHGGEPLTGPKYRGGCYVRPALVAARHDLNIVHAETFAPILYVMSYRDFAEALAWQNEVPQGLSSAVFTNNVREAELFLSARGSDCGIANVNLGTSGAEIGGAFGGEKETGGGRESGSDAWKAYMRRQTATVNFGARLPLSQGIHFGP